MVFYIRAFVIAEGLSHPLVLGPSALSELGIEFYDSYRNNHIKFSPLFPKYAFRTVTTVLSNRIKDSKQLPNMNAKQMASPPKTKKSKKRSRRKAKPKKKSNIPINSTSKCDALQMKSNKHQDSQTCSHSMEHHKARQKVPTTPNLTHIYDGNGSN